MKNIMCTDHDDAFPSIAEIDSLTRDSNTSDDDWASSESKRNSIIECAKTAFNGTVKYDIGRWSEYHLDRIDEIYCNHFTTDNDSIVSDYGTNSASFLEKMARYRLSVIDYMESQVEKAKSKKMQSPFPPSAIARTAFFLSSRDDDSVPLPILTSSVIEIYHQIFKKVSMSISEVSAINFKPPSKPVLCADSCDVPQVHHR